MITKRTFRTYSARSKVAKRFRAYSAALHRCTAKYGMGTRRSLEEMNAIAKRLNMIGRRGGVFDRYGTLHIR